MRRLLGCATALLALSTVSSAQLIVAHDDTSGGTNAWLVDVCTGTSEVLWDDTEAWGVAADDANGKVYVADGSTFAIWDYSQQGTNTPPTPIGTFTDPGGTTTYVPLGLAFANGKLYGYRTTGDEIFEIDTTTGVCTVVYNTDTALSLGGLAFNPADGLFYGTNDSSSGAGYGLYSLDVFGVGGDNLVVAYPNGETDVDGLAIGDNRAYLITDDLGDEIYTYDLALGAWLPGATLPFTSTEIFSAGAWAPGLTLTSVPTPYCSSQVNSNGCTPAIAYSGTPSATSGPFDITADQMLNNSIGILFFGYDRNDLPYLGGTLCVSGSVRRTGAQNSGGTPPGTTDCTGTFSYPMGALIQSGSVPELIPGACVYAQYWSRDPGAATTSNLSDALSFRIEP
jgi:hypothetical protein